MEDLIKLISEYGVMLFISGVFLWNNVKYAKTTDSMLREVRDKVQSLELLTSTLTYNQSILTENRNLLVSHDHRAEDIAAAIKTIQATLVAMQNGKNTVDTQ